MSDYLDLDYKLMKAEKELEELLREKYEEELTRGWEAITTIYEFKECNCLDKKMCGCESYSYFKTEESDKPDYISENDEESIFNDNYDDLTEEEKSSMKLVSQSTMSYTMYDYALRNDIIDTVQRRRKRSRMNNLSNIFDF